MTAANGAAAPKGQPSAKNEPLQRFTEAKRHMADIYRDLQEYVNELDSFYKGLSADNQKFTPPPAQVAEVKHFQESIKTIKDMFSRDKMKVVFFGRTSNGKSSVINAMLHSKVLPQGMGHTTCCFLQVQGSASEADKHFQKEDSPQKHPLAELDSVGHALSVGNSNDSLIKIFYPKSSSKLLQNDVVIVDSPGVDVSEESDAWIDKHCLDADVFVLVCNSEGTLTNTEKRFFHRVASKLSRPNLFILNNRWDFSAGEEEHRREQLRNQHQQRFLDFLVSELKVCTPAQAKDRFFFVSAREMLESRLKAKGELKSAYQQDGFQRRAMEFSDFEAAFEKLISQSAIRTKFEAHNGRARDIIMGMRYNLDTVHGSSLREKQRLALDLELKTKEFFACRENFRSFEQRYEREQKKIRAEVHLKVSADFFEEVSRLESIFDKFVGDFSDDPGAIDVYKKRLAEYVDKLVTSDLENQCTGGLMARVWSLENAMYAHVKDIIGQQYAGELDKIWRYKQPFKFTIAINCPQMVADFHEDLEFRFSLGIESIARRVLSLTRGQPITAIGENVLGGQTDANQQRQEVDTFIAKVFVQSATYLANGSVGLAIAGLIVYKNVDWRWLAGGAALVGGLYAFERYKWNSGAKEERLKDQFRSHLEQRMQMVEHVHTGHCEQQVVNELDQVYEGLRATVAGIHREMKERIDDTKRGVEKVDHVVKGLSTLKGKTNFVSSNLEAFATKFLTPDSPQ